MVYNDRFIDHITTTVLLITTPKIEHGMRWNESVLPCSHARSCKQPCNKNTSSCRSDCVFSTACTRPPLQCALYLTRNLYCKRTGLRSCSYRGPMPGQKKTEKPEFKRFRDFIERAAPQRWPNALGFYGVNHHCVLSQCLWEKRSKESHRDGTETPGDIPLHHFRQKEGERSGEPENNHLWPRTIKVSKKPKDISQNSWHF